MIGFMKMYITARFKGIKNKGDIEGLCAAVRESGLQDFCFIRDIENFQRTFPDTKQLWARTKIELKQCQALLIDVSDDPGGGRVIEAGMAFALEIPIIVIVKKGVQYNQHYNGIAAKVIEYDSYADIIEPLKSIV